MALSLKELALQKIATEVYDAPPMMQEMIMNETKDRIKEQAKKEIEEEVYENLLCNLSKDITNILTYLIPYITDDIIKSMSNANFNRPDFYEKYKNLPYIVVKCAVEASENIVHNMEERYVHNVFENMNEQEENDYDY